MQIAEGPVLSDLHGLKVGGQLRAAELELLDDVGDLLEPGEGRDDQPPPPPPLPVDVPVLVSLGVGDHQEGGLLE